MITCATCHKTLTFEEANSPCPKCGSFDRSVCASDQADLGEQALITAKTAAAQELAKKHYEIEDGLKQIFRLTSKAEAEVSHAEPIKLLEVNENTVPSGVLPLHFGAAPASGIPFPSIIIEVTPDEFAKIRAHELKLPKDWEIGEELPKVPASAGGV